MAAVLLAACADMNYDVTEGIDTEVTLFSEQVSLPVGDIGPFTVGIMLEKAGLRDMITQLLKENEDGHLVWEEEYEFYESWDMLIPALLPDPSQPTDFPVENTSDSFDAGAGFLSELGLAMPKQRVTLFADNPLTEGISVSGKVKIFSSEEDDETPAEEIVSQEFSHKKVSADTRHEDFLVIERDNGKIFGGYELEDLLLHLPGNIQEKDALGGFGFFRLGYKYTAYMGLGEEFTVSMPIDISDLNLPIGQYRVKEARIRTDVSNEIPMTLIIDKVEILVAVTDEEGKTTIEPMESISVTPDITIASGSTGAPTVTPLEVEIKAEEGTIPDISGLRINFTINAPTGDGDKRLGLNQNVYFNNLRATVSGGITIQTL